MNQKPNKVLLHNNQNESRFLDHFENLSIISNNGNYNWTYNGEEVTQQDVKKLHQLHALPEIINKLKYLSPIFSRHFDDQPLMELHYRKIALTVVNLASLLEEENVNVIVFPFGSNHWIEGFILELAGELVGAKLVFLYATVVDSRLLPLVQTNGVESRKIISQEFSDFSLRSDVFMRVKKTVDNSHPKTLSSQYIPFERVSKFIIHLYYAKMFFTRRKKFSRDDSAEISGFTLRSELKVLREQNKAIRLYQDYCEQDLNLVVFPKSPSSNSAELPIVIFSHFQPEATSFPDGGKWANIIDVVASIRASGYSQVIYYREHPALIASANSINKYPNRIGCARSREFYSQLRILGCVFINDVNAAEDEYIALTITGTIAIERSLRGYKTIVAGYPWFLGMPGQIRLEDFLCQGPMRDEFLHISHFGPAAIEFLKLHFDKKSMSNILNQDMFNLEFSSEEVAKFREDFNSLITILSSAQDLDAL